MIEEINDKNDITIRTIKDERNTLILMFNYLTVSGIQIGLLVNFRREKLEWKRLQVMMNIQIQSCRRINGI